MGAPFCHGVPRGNPASLCFVLLGAFLTGPWRPLPMGPGLALDEECCEHSQPVPTCSVLGDAELPPQSLLSYHPLSLLWWYWNEHKTVSHPLHVIVLSGEFSESVCVQLRQTLAQSECVTVSQTSFHCQLFRYIYLNLGLSLELDVLWWT